MRFSNVVLSGLALFSAAAFAAPQAETKGYPAPSVEQFRSDVLAADQGTSPLAKNIEEAAREVPNANAAKRREIEDRLTHDFDKIVNILYPLADQVEDDLTMIGRQTLTANQRDSIRETLELIKSVAGKIQEAVQATYDIGDTSFVWIAQSYSKQTKEELKPIVREISDFGNKLRRGSFQRDVLGAGGDLDSILNNYN